MRSILTYTTNLWQQPRVRQAIQFIWTTLIILFITLAIVANWDTIRAIEWTPERLGFLGFAIVAALLRKLLAGVMWALIVRLVGKNQAGRARDSMKIYFFSNLAMYLPGTYWFIAGRIMMHSKHGMSTLQTSVGILLEQFLLVLSGGMLGIWWFDLVAAALDIHIESVLWIILMVVVGLIAIHPKVLSKVIHLMTRLFKLEPSNIDISYHIMLVLLLCALMVWLMGSLSLLLQTHAFVPEFPLTPMQVGVFGAIFAISWLIGFFTPFAPSGIGVREGVMGLALAAAGVPIEFNVLILALARLLIIAEDVFWAAAALLF